MFVFSPKYFRTILLIGEIEEVKSLRAFIETKAPTNQVVGCISTEKCEENIKYFNEGKLK